MLITLDFESEKPIYQQLYETIITSLATGELVGDSQLPAVRTLAEEIGINLHTVNKAYNLLKEEGYVSIDRRKGAKLNAVPIAPKDGQCTQLEEELALLCAKAYLLGQSKTSILAHCEAYFNQYEEAHHE